MRIETGANNNTIGGVLPGEGNLITSNTSDGVVVDGSGSLSNAIRYNAIFGKRQTGDRLDQRRQRQPPQPPLLKCVDGLLYVPFTATSSPFWVDVFISDSSFHIPGGPSSEGGLSRRINSSIPPRRL